MEAQQLDRLWHQVMLGLTWQSIGGGTPLFATVIGTTIRVWFQDNLLGWEVYVAETNFKDFILDLTDEEVGIEVEVVNELFEEKTTR